MVIDLTFLFLWCVTLAFVLFWVAPRMMDWAMWRFGKARGAESVAIWGLVVLYIIFSSVLLSVLRP